ncbi:MAG: SGNH/GDSL hydrolase family protein [Bacteroidetes bacterium]|nr:SGNH/GDSL hydrolase family protein [Bacteroidota bacterium]
MQKITVILFLICFSFCTGSMNHSAAEPVSFLALGDSYTIGEGVAVKDSWPHQLAARLTKEGIPVESPQIIARTGWRTDNLISAFQDKNLAEKYDLVSVLIGVNNQFQGKSVEAYANDLRELLNLVINQCSRGKSGVFVLSIPDYGSTPFGKTDREAIGKEIDQWNAVCKSVCDEFEVPFYDITTVSKKAAADASLTSKDNLHPSGKMYALWVNEIYSKVANLLK